MIINAITSNWSKSKKFVSAECSATNGTPIPHSVPKTQGQLRKRGQKDIKAKNHGELEHKNKTN